MDRISGLINSRFYNLIMAVGLVIIYFFIDGLIVNFKPASLKIDGKDVFHLVEAHEITPLQVFESSPDDEVLELQAATPEEVESVEDMQEVVEVSSESTQLESQGFYTPNQVERPNLISPRGDTPSLSEIPLHMVIPVIGLDAPIMSVQPELVNVGRVELLQWISPNEYAAGWHETSAKLGEVGNTVINGHHNTSGEVFKRLVELIEGDLIKVYSDQHLFTYQITNKMILPEKYEMLEVRIKNAQWILPSQDERLTLITCWPYESNTHRLIIVAKPILVEAIPDIDQELLPRIYDENSS